MTQQTFIIGRPKGNPAWGRSTTMSAKIFLTQYLDPHKSLPSPWKTLGWFETCLVISKIPLPAVGWTTTRTILCHLNPSYLCRLLLFVTITTSVLLGETGVTANRWRQQDLPTGPEELCFTFVVFLPTRAVQIRSLPQGPDYIPFYLFFQSLYFSPTTSRPFQVRLMSHKGKSVLA